MAALAVNRDPLGSHGRLVYDSAPPSPPPVVCHPGGTAAYDMHRASMTVDAATAWCRNNSKCAGFCAQSAGACKSTDVLDLHFLDGWAIHRTGSNASWTSWSTDAEAPPPTQRVQVFAKPMSNGARAVAVLNRGDAAVDATVNLSTIALPEPSNGQRSAKPWARAKVRDLWLHKDEGEFDGSFTVKSLAPHATALLMMTAVDAVTAKTDDGLAGGDVVSLAPQPNCTKKLHLCYQGSQMNIAEVVRLDPLACKPPNATLRAENCSQQGYSDSVGFDPIFKKVSLWKKQGGGGGGGGGVAKAASLRRWAGSTSCEGQYSVLSIDVLDQCTPYHIPAPASILVVRKNGSAYESYHYQGATDCTGPRTFLEALAVGTCSGDLGGYSQMRVWEGATLQCSPGCECCPCTGTGCKGTCPACGAAVCSCPPL